MYQVVSCHTDYFLGHHASTGERISHHALSLTWQYFNPFEWISSNKLFLVSFIAILGRIAR